MKLSNALLVIALFALPTTACGPDYERMEISGTKASPLGGEVKANHVSVPEGMIVKTHVVPFNDDDEMMQAHVFSADPDILEEWKWENPVWSHEGIVCTGETYKKAVKMTFARGAFLNDPSRLFNSSLEGNTRRAIDIHEGEKIDARALKALIRAAVALNVAGRKTAPRKR